MGFDSAIFASLVSKAILRGTENYETSKALSKHTRKVFTLPLLKLLGYEIAKTNWFENSKKIRWTYICVSFFVWKFQNWRTSSLKSDYDSGKGLPTPDHSNSDSDTSDSDKSRFRFWFCLIFFPKSRF